MNSLSWEFQYPIFQPLAELPFQPSNPGRYDNLLFIQFVTENRFFQQSFWHLLRELYKVLTTLKRAFKDGKN
jgi:hypothetical protein